MTHAHWYFEIYMTDKSSKAIRSDCIPNSVATETRIHHLNTTSVFPIVLPLCCIPQLLGAVTLAVACEYARAIASINGGADSVPLTTLSPTFPHTLVVAATSPVGSASAAGVPVELGAGGEVHDVFFVWGGDGESCGHGGGEEGEEDFGMHDDDVAVAVVVR